MSMTITMSRLRDTLKRTCDQVCDEHQPVFVQCKKPLKTINPSRKPFIFCALPPTPNGFSNRSPTIQMIKLSLEAA